jgi:hypothetical protein
MDNYTDINFGLARAELEAARYPQLLTQGFLDNRKAAQELVEGHRFLVLGHKGSGKSAIGEKIRMSSGCNSPQMSQHVLLGDFPFESFGRIMPGKAEAAAARYPTSWSWLLLVLFVDSLCQDQAVHRATDSQLLQAGEALREMGLLPADNIPRLVRSSSKKSFKVQIPKLLEFTSEKTWVPEELDLQLITLVRQLKSVVKDADTPNQHILVLDGLDDILTQRKIQYDSIAALIFEADRLNLEFLQAGSHCKIVVLCRTDLFEKLPGPNKNKLRQDSALELDWYHDPRSPENSDLISLMNLRASLSADADIDVFGRFFPKEVNNKPVHHFLLDHTRHTPRDFIQLMNHLKPFFSGRKFTREEILSGIREYSKNYFLPEIRDEMVGYTGGLRFDTFIRILSSFRDREISYRNLAQECDRVAGIKEEELQRILSDLFNCSAVGNKSHRHERRGRYYFKYRNRNDSISFDDTIVVHKGTWKALGLV